LSRAFVLNYFTPTGEFFDFRNLLKFSAFLFGALIFFVSFSSGEKKKIEINQKQSAFMH